MNANEIYEIALKIEENGELFYRLVAKHVNNSEVKKRVQQLANWEEGHIQKIKELRSQLIIAEESGLFESYEEDTSLYINAIADSHIFISGTGVEDIMAKCKTTNEMLEVALKFEIDTVTFYKSLRDTIRSSDAKDALDSLVSEEISHVAFIKKLMETAK